MKEQMHEILMNLNRGRMAVSEAQEQLLDLFSVSQQHELLLAYEEWRCENPDKLGYEAEQYVDWYIKANNCG